MRDLRIGISPPWTIAHRGSSASHPENTVTAFNAALAEGCDGIELDVQLAADGTPFVFHDRTFSRIGGGRRRASLSPMDAVGAMDAGSWFHPRFYRERILTLDDVFDRYGGRTFLLVELKARPPDKRSGAHLRLARAVADRIKARRLERKTALLCFDLEALMCAREAAPSLQVALNLRPRRRLPAPVRNALGSLWALSLDVRSVLPAHVRAAHEAGRPALVYTCNTERRVRRALACGADAVMSDRPGWLAGLLAGHRR